MKKIEFECKSRIAFKVIGTCPVQTPNPLWDANYKVGKLELVLWDEGNKDTIREFVVNSETPTFIDYETNCNVINMSAFLVEGRYHVATVSVQVEYFKEGLKSLIMCHPLEDDYHIILELSKYSESKNDNTFIMSKLGTNETLRERSELYNKVVENQCENVKKLFQDSVQKLYHNDEKVASECMFPAKTCGSDFAILNTRLPLSRMSYKNGTTNEERLHVNINMSQLQKTLHGRGRSLSVPFMAYLFHASYLFNGFDQLTD